MRFLDANIILRYLTRDDDRKAAACYALFQRVKDGAEEVTLSEVIIHEVLYVLCSNAHYRLHHDAAAARLRPLLTLRGLKLPHKRRYLRALDLYASSSELDTGDALALAHMEEMGIGEILSYDTDFDDREGITRVEPPMAPTAPPPAKPKGSVND